MISCGRQSWNAWKILNEEATALNILRVNNRVKFMQYAEKLPCSYQQPYEFSETTLSICQIILFLSEFGVEKYVQERSLKL